MYFTIQILNIWFITSASVCYSCLTTAKRVAQNKARWKFYFLISALVYMTPDMMLHCPSSTPCETTSSRPRTSQRPCYFWTTRASGSAPRPFRPELAHNFMKMSDIYFHTIGNTIKIFGRKKLLNYLVYPNIWVQSVNNLTYSLN